MLGENFIFPLLLAQDMAIPAWNLSITPVGPTNIWNTKSEAALLGVSSNGTVQEAAIHGEFRLIVSVKDLPRSRWKSERTEGPEGSIFHL
jgi:hypothetical protein